MMAIAIALRELEEHPRDILRRVRERGEVIDVADGDVVIARIVPVRDEADRVGLDEWWDEIDRLAEEIGQQWPTGVSAADAIAEDRE